jgi:hypothetical protein
MLGSVAESVVRSCHTCVLVIPPLAARVAVSAPAAVPAVVQPELTAA